MTQPIKLENLRDLVTMGVVTTATILGQKGGYAVLAKLGAQDRILATKAGEVKMFATTDTAVRELVRVGLSSFLVDTSLHEKQLLRAPREDVRARAKAASESLAYDRWVRSQLDEAVAEEENGTATWHAHDDVWREVLAEAARLTAERDAAAKPKAKVAAPPKHSNIIQKNVHQVAQQVRRAAAKK